MRDPHEQVADPTNKDGDGDHRPVSQADYEKLLKQVQDKEAFIAELKSEGHVQRDKIGELAEKLANLEGRVQATPRTPEPPRKTKLDEFKEKLSDEKFREDLNANPATAVEKMLDLIASEREMTQAQQRQLNSILLGLADTETLTRAEAEKLAQEKIEARLATFPEELKLKEEAEMYSDAIATLRENPLYKDLDARILVQFAKDAGATPKTGYAGSAAIGRRAPSQASSKMPDVVRREVMDAAMKLHKGNQKKIDEYVSRFEKKYYGGK